MTAYHPFDPADPPSGTTLTEAVLEALDGHVGVQPAQITGVRHSDSPLDEPVIEGFEISISLRQYIRAKILLSTLEHDAVIGFGAGLMGPSQHFAIDTHVSEMQRARGIVPPPLLAKLYQYGHILTEIGASDIDLTAHDLPAHQRATHHLCFDRGWEQASIDPEETEQWFQNETAVQTFLDMYAISAENFAGVAAWYRTFTVPSDRLTHTSEVTDFEAMPSLRDISMPTFRDRRTDERSPRPGDVVRHAVLWTLSERLPSVRTISTADADPWGSERVSVRVRPTPAGESGLEPDRFASPVLLAKLTSLGYRLVDARYNRPYDDPADTEIVPRELTFLRSHALADWFAATLSQWPLAPDSDAVKGNASTPDCRSLIPYARELICSYRQLYELTNAF